jgi:hypothetical protein
MSVLQAISVVLDRLPELRYGSRTSINTSYSSVSSVGSVSFTDGTSIFCRQEGLAHEVLQWYLCRMEAWFAADADMISLQTWDQASSVSDLSQLIVLWLIGYTSTR